MTRLFRDVWELGKPTIAKVRGYALAGGFGLALMCDVVIAADDAAVRHARDRRGPVADDDHRADAAVDAAEARRSSS